MWRWVLTLAWIGSAAGAEIVTSSVPVVIEAVGGQCEHAPDEVIVAPGAGGGQAERTFGFARYVVTGDRFAAQKGLGIGVRVRMAGYEPGRTVTALIEPPVGRTGSWDVRVDQDGGLDFGRFPAVGEALPQGRYLLSLLDGGKVLFSYAITLVGETDDGLCLPNVS